MTKMMTPVLGSYKKEDCQFLLQTINPNYKTIEDKERLIQTGKMHYSEFINKENPPSSEYVELFLKMTEKYKKRLASEIMSLARLIAENKSGFGEENQDPIVLLSLARAGTPIAVLVYRALKMMNVNAVHYSISIVRDKGIDENALHYVKERYQTKSACFIDGWTAKGVITKELHHSIDQYNKKFGTKFLKDLYVVSDIGGTADHTATFDDYTIPSALMNSTVSGLMSRTMLNEQTKNGFHGCVYYKELEPYDKSVWFIEQIQSEMSLESKTEKQLVSKDERRKQSQIFFKSVMQEHNVSDINRIKPGIAEATRVMLRRVPDIIIVNKFGDPNMSHLEQIAKEKNIPILLDENMPIGACAIIKDVT